MPIFRYEDLYIGLPAIFYRTADQDGDGFHHVQLICSRDMRDWKRLGDRRAFIGPSPVDSGAYDLTRILPPSRPILRGDELWFYYTGIKYRCPPEGARDLGAVCLAALRRCITSRFEKQRRWIEAGVRTWGFSVSLSFVVSGRAP